MPRHYLGNVTPIPTTGELEELDSVEDPTITEEAEEHTVEEVIPSEQLEPLPHHPESRSTPLKSLLKKPSFDADGDESDSNSDDGNVSPKKVHFSEIDQVKLMSQESLASMATSEGSDANAPSVTMCTTSMTTTAVPSMARIVNNRLSASQEEYKKSLERSLGDIRAKTEESLFVSKPSPGAP